MARKTSRTSTGARRGRSRAQEGKATEAELPFGLHPMLLEAMSLRAPARGGAERRLTTAEVEHALISGEHAQTLELYFGEAEYAELRQLAARATRRSVRGGPRVLILPGILGSMLARALDGGSYDTIWIDFLDIFRGRLSYLALPEGKRMAAIDVHLGTYLKLKLWLQDQGFDADFHPYDWRLGIPELGRELAERVRGDPAERVFVVAHSMGGLVARAAVRHGMPKLERLVMLGTPNFGSFAPAMVYRAVYPFLDKVAMLDVRHSAEELAGQIFNTFPGLAQMLPQRAKFSAVDLYDLAAWPTRGPRPRGELLRAAPAAQQKLAVQAERFVMIAGVDQETTVGLRVEAGEFVFQRSRAGDGTVPLELAVLPDVQTYYIAEEHGSLPKNATVFKAVAEILRGGATSVLSPVWDGTRADAVVEMEEDELRRRFQAAAARSTAHLSASDLRNVVAELAAPSTPALVLQEAPAAAIAPPTGTLFEGLVIGRRLQRRIDVRLAQGSITQVRSRAYVLGLFQSVAPAGAASAIDVLMDGAITDFRQRRMFTSAVGEIFVVPRGRSEVCADFVVFAGLGSFDAFNLQVLETVAENVARTMARLSIEEFATVSIGAGTGLDSTETLQVLLRGVLRGLQDADAMQAFRSITICEIDEARYETLKWALYRLCSTELCAGVEMTLTELKLPPAPVVRRAALPGLPPSIYLTVRTSRAGSNLRIESSLLTAGAKATVLSGEATVADATLRRQLAQIEGEGFQYAQLSQFGSELAKLVLDGAVVAGLQSCSGLHVVVVHDAEASRIPWETLCIEGKFPALQGGMSRRYVAANLSVAKWLEARREDEWLDILLVVDPTQDLQGAREEGSRIDKLFADRQRVRLKRIEGRQATRARLKSEFTSGKYDILHYAGHAYFDPERVQRSGILCADGPLMGSELADLGTLPSLVFFNACESARVRRQVRRESAHVSKDLRQRMERSAGLAEAFLRGGVANYVGTYWPVGDASAKEFAGTFYGALLEGDALGEALNQGRAAVEKLRSVDWADYIFYGSIDFRIKEGSGRGAG